MFEFIRRFLQHVLPPGFMKVRHYGFMSANSKISTDELRELVKEAGNLVNDCETTELAKPPKLLCPHCQIALVHKLTLILSPPNFEILIATG